MEPGISFQCADCGLGSEETFEWTDHFKHCCEGWSARKRLAKGFARLHEMGLLAGNHHLNNDAINAMMDRGVTIQRILRQPKDWLPNEPMCDHNRNTGRNEDTGVVPTEVWLNLPSQLRREPVAQDNTIGARHAAQDLQGAHIDEIGMNAPAAVEARKEMEIIQVWHEAQLEVRDRVVPGHEALLQENGGVMKHMERLESQIGSAKRMVQSLLASDHITAAGAGAMLANFDPMGHPLCIAPLHVSRWPNQPVTPHPNTPVVNTSGQDIDFLQKID